MALTLQAPEHHLRAFLSLTAYADGNHYSILNIDTKVSSIRSLNHKEKVDQGGCVYMRWKSNCVRYNSNTVVQEW